MKSLPLLLTLGLLAGCATAPRTEPPAPIERARSALPNPKPVEKPRVETFAYHPPSTAPDAPPEEVQEDLEEKPVPKTPSEAFASLPSEAATSENPQQSADAGAAQEAQTQAEPKPAPSYNAPPPPMPELSPAVRALVLQAEQQREMRDYVGAAATLERALRIAPQEAYLYNRLARVRLEQGQYAQAGNFAQRSNALAKEQPQLQQDNWGMIAVSRQVAGDAEGAEAAQAKALGEGA